MDTWKPRCRGDQIEEPNPPPANPAKTIGEPAKTRENPAPTLGNPSSTELNLAATLGEDTSNEFKSRKILGEAVFCRVNSPKHPANSLAAELKPRQADLTPQKHSTP
jgi:hypothetical protein